MALVLIGLLSGSVMADRMNEEVLDARLEKVDLLQKYTTDHPSVKAHEAKLQVLEKESAALSPEDYRKLVQKRLITFKAEKANLLHKYTMDHPIMKAHEAKLQVLEKELKEVSPAQEKP